MSRRSIAVIGIVTVAIVVAFVLARRQPGPEVAARVLRMTESPPTLIDPALGTDFSSTTSHVNLYDALVWPGTDGEIEPHLAESWEASPDGLVWTFRLRRGVQFHHGHGELTANDVVFTFRRLIAIGEGFSYLYQGRVANVEAVDTHTVRFTLSRPFGPFLATLLRLAIVSEACVRANKKDGPYGEWGDYGRDYLTTNDCGSGPYVMRERVVGESFAAERFADYWIPFPAGAPDRFVLMETTEAATVRTLMERRELEITDQWQSLEAYNTLQQIQGVDVARIADGSMLYLMLHNRKAPTDDVNVRRALAWAMNYQQVTDSIFPGTSQARGPVAATLPGHDATVFQYRFDLERARAELAQSRYADRIGQMPIDYCWTAEVPDLEKIALMFQADLARIGVRVNIVSLPWLRMIEAASRPETTCHIMSIWVAPHYPEAGSILESKYHSRATGTWEQTEWVRDPELDRMIDDALATIDRQERFRKYAEIQRRIVEMAPTIWVYEQVSRHAYQSGYVEWPQAKRPIPVMGYNMAARLIQVYPERARR
ncbi:MAG: ABC transporter substrate-binding protein [Armatimonadota bacterium]|nr:ABC transporter substrate-binding protein [Armatimonadota bacterium]